MQLFDTIHCHSLAPSSSPTVTTANATGPRSLYLEWGLPPPVTHNGVIRSFTIVLLEVDTGLTISYDAVNTSKSISSLHPYYMYQCEVHAFTVRNGPPSEPVYITTLEDGMPARIVCAWGGMLESTALLQCYMKNEMEY